MLPDHLHCLWTLPPGDGDFSTRWRLIKAAFVRLIEASEPLSERRQAKGERSIWQRVFWEHAIRDERDFAAHVDILHFGPVKHGHAAKASAWPHSSLHKFVAAGVYDLAWGASDSISSLDLE